MELNDIKKFLYKNKPKAILLQVTKNVLNYKVDIREGDSYLVVQILVPIEDIGDASFFPEMEAQLLIRWIIKK